MDNPKIAQKSPFVMEMKAGKYAFCTCGESSKQPFCNGAHSPTNFRPEIIIIEEDRTVAWCGCKHTKNSGFCDGSHARV